jgi:ribosomal protein L37E
MEDDTFRKQIEHLLKATGRTFQGIHLRCKACGEEAFAATPETAEMFGWSRVTVREGSNYEGFCIECKPQKVDSKGGTS